MRVSTAFAASSIIFGALTTCATAQQGESAQNLNSENKALLRTTSVDQFEGGAPGLIFGADAISSMAHDFNGLSADGYDHMNFDQSISMGNEQTTVPAPGSLLLIGLGGFVALGKRQKRAVFSLGKATTKQSSENSGAVVDAVSKPVGSIPLKSAIMTENSQTGPSKLTPK